MSKHTHHHPTPKRGPRAGAAHKAWAKERMDAKTEAVLRGRQKVLAFLFDPAMRRDVVITRATRIASALRRAFA